MKLLHLKLNLLLLLLLLLTFSDIFYTKPMAKLGLWRLPQASRSPSPFEE